jgi:hypothetical protein
MERMHNRIPKDIVLQEGPCQLITAHRPYEDMVVIHRGFVMPDSAHKNKEKRADINRKAQTGVLDSYELVAISPDLLHKLHEIIENTTFPS